MAHAAHHEQMAGEHENNDQKEPRTFSESKQRQKEDDKKRQEAAEQMQDRVFHGDTSVLRIHRVNKYGHVVCRAAPATKRLNTVTDVCRQFGRRHVGALP